MRHGKKRMALAQILQGTWEELSAHAEVFGDRRLTLLVPTDAETQDDTPSDEIAKLAMAGRSFDWLAEEPDIYDETSGGVDCRERNK